MKYIEVDEQVYRFIASKTERIGESASDILRRLLGMEIQQQQEPVPAEISQPGHSQEGADVEVAQEVVTQVEETCVHSSEFSSEDFKQLIGLTALSEQKGAIGRFLFLLQQSHYLLKDDFKLVLQVQGKGRLYFALSDQELLNSSASAKPRQIGDSRYWVATNSNTERKRRMLNDVLVLAGCHETIAQQIVEQI